MSAASLSQNNELTGFKYQKNTESNTLVWETKLKGVKGRPYFLQIPKILLTSSTTFFTPDRRNSAGSCC